MYDTRPPAVAGTFYPADPVALTQQLESYLAAPELALDPSAIKAVIAPHAGYVYSGPIAGSVFALLSERAKSIKRVLLLGPAHRVSFQGVALPGARKLRTPLGDVSVAQIAGVVSRPDAHAGEHCLEVELPFLQHVLARDVEVTPLLVGDASPEAVAKLLDEQWGGDETLIVVSSDLSHYLSYAEARARDAASVEKVLALDPTLNHEDACGATPVNALLIAAAKHGLTPTLCDLRNSGDTAGDKRRVVGYASFAFTEPRA